MSKLYIHINSFFFIMIVINTDQLKYINDYIIWLIIKTPKRGKTKFIFTLLYSKYTSLKDKGKNIQQV
jgi:hypothetical protein